MDGSIAALTGPPSDTVTLVGAAASLGTAAATVGAQAVTSTVVSDATEARGLSLVTGASVDVPLLTPLIGGVLVDTGASVIRAEAICPVGGPPTATVDPPAALTVAGQEVVLDADGDATVEIISGGLAAGTVVLSLDTTSTTTATAAATALSLSFALDLADGAGTVTGTVVIAEATCEAPAAAPVAPTATDIDPDSGPTAGGTSVEVTGSGFVPGATSVTIGGVLVPAEDVTVAPGGETLSFVTPPHAAGLVDVVVSTPGGDSAPLGFTYLAAPTASEIDPDEGPSTGGTPVEVTGTGFVPGQTTVTIGGVLVPAEDVTVAPGGETLAFVTPPHAPGPVDVIVSTPGGDSAPLGFTYRAAPAPVAPVASEVDPGQGPTSGGTTVVVTGSGFVPGATTVTIGGIVVPADQVTVSPDGTSASFVTPPHAAGVVDIVLTTPGGSTDPLPFAYVASDGLTAGAGDRNDGGTVGGADGNRGGAGYTGPLARTGTSATTTLVLTGLAALFGGLVLLQGRRRLLRG